jgi:hypothetical protein
MLSDGRQRNPPPSTPTPQPTEWIATFVGMHWEAIEDRIAAWCGDAIPGWDGRSFASTVSSNVGYFAPRAPWLEHRIEPEGVSIEECTQPNISDVTDVGLNFMRSHAGDRDGAYRELEGLRRRIEEASFMSVRYVRFIEGFEGEFPLK